jgi:hypothetical protein
LRRRGRIIIIVIISPKNATPPRLPGVAAWQTKSWQK